MEADDYRLFAWNFGEVIEKQVSGGGAPVDDDKIGLVECDKDPVEFPAIGGGRGIALRDGHASK